ncbi:protein of unknown function (plasmid) [Cupriavidus taiwanensis]|uniref:Uncharacterized protein n=1 Tax=Cupriavidus taiwanensis TaxID=164546 RepID=A0A375IPR5_9BURK|nr:hypothetical protein CBM2592_B90082 [Cupriavidus taiwanensis]SOY73685.1 hypothetical protein CBM2588_B90001 [Cupriavidus taiwanensis]SOY97639.1 hypothetical protein CBM2591_B70082 [Cupriavidus taiwanensis]SOZ31008.1 hypothetical protein CBM2608_B60264 [Cupriavidus taiwanensis]SOZ67614.1 hypothetical protein CBM2617_B110001 [Cupriavidus taiwanensis]
MVALSLTNVACGRLHDARPNAKVCLAGAKALAGVAGTSRRLGWGTAVGLFFVLGGRGCFAGVAGDLLF